MCFPILLCCIGALTATMGNLKKIVMSCFEISITWHPAVHDSQSHANHFGNHLDIIL